MKYKRISDFPKSQAESISVLGVEDGHNVQMEVLSKKATLQNIQKGVANKANKDGNHPKMTAGFAQEIVGDGSATPEEFSFRPTAGEDRNVANTTYYDGVSNGVARIEKIKGNSVVWNQLLSNTLSSNNDGGGGWRHRMGIDKLTIEDGKVITTITLMSNQVIVQKVNIKANHKYLVIINNIQYTYETDDFNRVGQCGLSNSENSATEKNIEIIYGNTKSIHTIISADADYTYFGFYLRGKVLQVSAFSFEKPRFVDLTQMFSAGNEPTTVEEFYQRLPVGIDISEYNEGTIIDGNYGAIKTVGFNAFNGTYAKVCDGCSYYLGGNYTSLGFTTEEGGITEAIALPTSTESVGTTPSDRLYTPSQNGYIYAEGENININISWDTEYGYLNGTYQPYKPFERDLSWIGRIKDSNGNLVFPNGMRSAGSVRDEIRFNSTTQKWEAVKRVGTFTIGEVNWTAVGDGRFYANIADLTAPTDDNNRNKDILCGKYPPSTQLVPQSMDDKSILRFDSDTTVRFYIKDTSYTDTATFKNDLQNVVCNYALATPIITEITEGINMDFDVSDYGTEELIVAEGAQSAPLVADITYAPNALSTLKQVPDILKRLKALESAVASATATINEEEIVE